ncbi:MAG: exonuclease SbcCD subunit D C-terminal domain-containing protein [Myxococcota bacterium]
MRILHTSDWHLGHTLHGVPRDREHACFLAWLADTAEERAIDALIIAGDIFDSANPPASAQKRWYGFLAEVNRRMPQLDVVVIGGNHDSAARLDAPTPLLRAMRIHMVGGVTFHSESDGTRIRRSLLTERLLAPLTDASGKTAAWVAAVPFLRPSDLPRPERRRASAEPADAAEPGSANDNEPPAGDPDKGAGEVSAGGPAGDSDRGDSDTPAGDPPGDPLIDGVRAIYAEALDAARARCGDSAALIATGHCYMVGTELSQLSERRILGGNQHALPVDIFPDDIAYVALGHLHKAQRVGGHQHVRYSGSPIPLAMSEARYRHQVCLVELRGTELVSVESVPIPRSVPVLRVPTTGAAPLPEVLDQLAALPASEPSGESGDEPSSNHSTEPETRPYLEVCVALPGPEVNLRQIIDTALDGKQARLLKLTIEYTGTGQSLAESLAAPNLRELDPGEVFLRRYRRDYEDEPEPALVAAFHDLLDQVSRGESASTGDERASGAAPPRGSA